MRARASSLTRLRSRRRCCKRLHERVRDLARIGLLDAEQLLRFLDQLVVARRRPARDRGEVAVVHAEPRAHEDARRPAVRRGLRVGQHLQPRDDVGHGRHLQQPAEVGHLERDVPLFESGEHGVEVPPRADEDRHVLPLRARRPCRRSISVAM